MKCHCTMWGSDINGALDMSEKILLVAGGASRDLSDRARGDIEVDDERERAVPDVLEFPTQHPTGLHGQVGVFGFQGLHARSFHPCSRSLLPVQPVPERFDTYELSQIVLCSTNRTTSPNMRHNAYEQPKCRLFCTQQSVQSS